jgi:hypothetical protein
MNLVIPNEVRDPDGPQIFAQQGSLTSFAMTKARKTSDFFRLLIVI